MPSAYLDRPPIKHKAELISEAFSLLPFRSVADLGGCWGVNGAYTFHAEQIAGAKFARGAIVDQTITPLTRERASGKIDCISAILGSAQAREAVGRVDALIIYDILLHQVKPDWNQFLVDWAPHTRMMVIYNQNWLKSDTTIRFVEHGLPWFLENVYHTDKRNVEKWFAEHFMFDDKQGKLKRDMHNFWQWGITSKDLIAVLASHGFDLVVMRSYGAFAPQFPWIVNEGFIFIKSKYR